MVKATTNITAMAKKSVPKTGRKSKADLIKLTEQAHIYFIYADYNQKQIAQLLGVMESTIGDWVRNGKWKEEKQVMDNTPRRLVADFYVNIEDIRRKAKEDDRTLTASETDSIYKLSAAIEKLNQKASPAMNMQVLMNFNNYLKQIDLELAKQFVQHQKEYISRLLDK